MGPDDRRPALFLKKEGMKWDGRDNSVCKVTGGVYIYTMRAGDYMQSRKMALLP